MQFVAELANVGDAYRERGRVADVNRASVKIGERVP
jgi:hypothetical protein